ncbi:YslB family protein [Metabacillus iocasae]|uniref:Hydrocarbon binding protein n=1 Tax=Priestia iocasae TaxID=2291674 RepID=A0ABS2QPP1_9BACI|nr:YslB family protein [Metabacillus iocasae]MBM7701288.1 putative hydrocarbon binding protein [Metabacillus iocasae]
MSHLHTEEKQDLQETTERDDKLKTQVPFFGYTLVRDILLTDLLGKDAEQILYWSGKNIARKFPLHSSDEIVSFFAEAGWGSLLLVKADKQTIEFELHGELVKKRLDEQVDCSFHLEAGFIAHQIQQQKQCIAESYLTVKERAGKVFITVKWDKKDIIS